MKNKSTIKKNKQKLINKIEAFGSVRPVLLI